LLTNPITSGEIYHENGDLVAELRSLYHPYIYWLCGI
jgi:hypothetical protein